MYFVSLTPSLTGYITNIRPLALGVHDSLKDISSMIAKIKHMSKKPHSLITLTLTNT